MPTRRSSSIIILVSLSTLIVTSNYSSLRAGDEPLGSEENSASERDGTEAELRSLQQQAQSLDQAGDLAGAIKTAEHALSNARKLYGGEDPLTVSILSWIAERHVTSGKLEAAAKVHRKILELQRKMHGENHWQTKDAAVALDLIERLLSLDETQRSKLADANDQMRLALDCYYVGELEQAATLAESAYETRKSVIGIGDYVTLTHANNLASIYHKLGLNEDAKQLYSSTLSERRQFLGLVHPDIAVTQEHLGGLFENLGKYPQALSAYEDALSIRKQVYGMEHSLTATTMTNLAGLFNLMGDHEKAAQFLENTLDVYLKVLGRYHPNTLTVRHNLIQQCSAAGLDDKAREMAERLVSDAKLSQQTGIAALGRASLASLDRSEGSFTASRSRYLQSLALFDEIPGVQPPHVFSVQSSLASLYEEMGKHSDAEQLYRGVIRSLQERFGASNPKTVNNLESLGVLHLKQGRLEEARKELRESLKARGMHLDATFAIQSQRQQLLMKNEMRYSLDACLALASQGAFPVDELYKQFLAWKGSVYHRQQQIQHAARHPELESTLRALQIASANLSAFVYSQALGDEKTRREQYVTLKSRRDELLIDLAAGTRREWHSHMRNYFVSKELSPFASRPFSSPLGCIMRL